MRAILVSHTHWDREWYRTYQAFRARLVDAVDQVLDLCAASPGYRFLLDGQSIVLEDYLELRPEREDELRAACAEGRIGLGPWYVQPDSLLPSGEAHVRNLLLGRRVAERIGPVSRVAYTPDSFGHPGQFPQLFAGFGLRAFVYWRGHGNELDGLRAEYDWVSPDGSRVVACHLGKGYFNAALAPGAELGPAAERIAQQAKELAARSDSGVLLLLNGIDHAGPEPRTEELAARLAEATGFEVERGLVDDFAEAVLASGAPRQLYAGELVGARAAPLLAGVWSTRTWIKQRNRQTETALEGWAEPFAALGRRFGLADERPALRSAWSLLLQNQAHDSICGCSRDEVHEQMRPRFDAAHELALETTDRGLERLAGLGLERRTPWTLEPDLAVFNPSPRPRTDVVRFPFDPHPFMVPAGRPQDSIHPSLLQDLSGASFLIDEQPARLVPAPPGRLTLIPDRQAYDLEFVARDVPALGWRRVSVRRGDAGGEESREVAAGSADAQIQSGDLRVCVREDGRFDLDLAGRSFERLGGLEDSGDRGDSYDHDPVEQAGAAELPLESLRVFRRWHPGGIQHLRIDRKLSVPVGVDPDRKRRAEARTVLPVSLEIRLAPGVPRVDLLVRVHNQARDHRLRLLFPVASPQGELQASTTFDLLSRRAGGVDDTGWVQRAPGTFCHQGFVHAGGLGLVAPGLPEAELLLEPESALALTLLRCVGHLSRHDLASRPLPAGPGTETPAAQCLGEFQARLHLLAGCDPVAAREAELGLRAVAAGDAPLLAMGTPLVSLEPSDLLLSALKPAEQGAGLVARLLNSGDETREARLRLGFPFEDAFPVGLDEQALDAPLERHGDELRFPVPPHALRSVHIL